MDGNSRMRNWNGKAFRFFAFQPKVHDISRGNSDGWGIFTPTSCTFGPGTTLGLLLSRALSSAQAVIHCIALRNERRASSLIDATEEKIVLGIPVTHHLKQAQIFSQKIDPLHEVAMKKISKFKRGTR